MVIEKRITKEDKLVHLLDDRMLEPFEYYQKLNLLNIQQNNNFNFALQNRIKGISSLNGHGLYDMMTQVIGTKKYNESKEKSLKILSKTDVNEENAFKILEQYREKLNELRYDKDDFDNYEKEIKKANK